MRVVTDWEGLLLEAAARAERAVSTSAKSEARRRSVGIGASGDKTLAADRDAENAILEVIGQTDDTRVVSEERGVIGRKSARWNVLVDPLDGSSNFERGIPFYCTSISVVQGNRMMDTQFAVVRNLVNGDVYFAKKGRGATKNNRAIQTSGKSELGESFVAVDLCSGGPAVVARLAILLGSVKRQLHFGANALELCALAEGSLDGFVDIRARMRVTDFGAGYLIVKEAGGVVTGDRGEEIDPRLDLQERFSYVGAGNPQLHRRLLEAIS